MPATSAHLTAETLEQLAEGSLPPAAATGAHTHLEACSCCASELDAIQCLFTLLGKLTRFAPSASFGDGVMARVQLAQESRVLALLRRLLPTTRRGWAMISVAVTAPAMPLIALVLWLLTLPLISPAAVIQWGLLQTQSAAQTAFAWLIDGALGSGLFGWAATSYTTLQTIPSSALGGGIAFLAIAIPLSGWGLVRLTRTPVGRVSHAN
ncbi:MAG: hypothetical protein GEU90_06465 [Gemmatimonas sp.]|nr:hypothetical protein [Gemmatimonas sp.]